MQLKNLNFKNKGHDQTNCDEIKNQRYLIQLNFSQGSNNFVAVTAAKMRPHSLGGRNSMFFYVVDKI